MKTTKRMLFFWLCMAALTLPASAGFLTPLFKPYAFSYEKSEGWHACVMDNVEHAGNWDKNKLLCQLEIFFKPGVITQIGFELMQWDTNPPNHVLDLCRLARAKSDKNIAIVDVTIYLANGETLTSPQLFISDRRLDGKKTKSYGNIDARFETSSFTSSLKNVSKMTKAEKQFYINSQLTKHNIKKLVIAGYSFEFENFRSAPTYRAMLNRLAQETGADPYTQTTGGSD